MAVRISSRATIHAGINPATADAMNRSTAFDTISAIVKAGRTFPSGNSMGKTAKYRSSAKRMIRPKMMPMMARMMT